ncbi:hypothetical protein HC928_10935 [bacterium]|nr:hypothetical protein [bacterium]
MNDSVFEDGVVGTVDQLNLFEPPVIQAAVQRSVIVEYRPTSHLSVTQDAPIHFSLGGDSRNYLDLQKTRLFVRAKIVTEDGKDIEKTDDVAPVNLTLQSLWSMVEMKIAGKTTNTPTNGCYPYMAMFQALLKNSQQAKEGPLISQMFYEENDMSNTALNLGYLKRIKFFTESASVCMEGPLVIDMCSTPRYILCNTAIDITLYRSRPEFVLMTSATDKKFKLVIEDICLKAHYLEVHPGIISGHHEALVTKKAKAIYPFTKLECKTFNIPSGSRSFYFDNIFNNGYPQRVLCALVQSDAFSGNFTKNPFDFEHFDLTQIEICADGVSVPSRPMTFKFDKEGRQAVTPFLRLYDAVGGSDSPLFGNGIDLESFCSGHSIFAFPLNGGGLQGNFLEVKRSANVCVRGTFGSALDKSVTLIIYSESPTVAEIDASRNIEIH